jgi:hypothetical protein
MPLKRPLGESRAVDPKVIAQLRRPAERAWLATAGRSSISALRGPHERWSDVILRLVEIEAKGRR